MDNGIKSIINTKVVLPDRIIENGYVAFKGRYILSYGNMGEYNIPFGTEAVDASGRITAPGFVDIHCHGGGRYEGHDYPLEAAREHLKYGTTSILTTIAYCFDMDTIIESVKKTTDLIKCNKNENILGIHMEGPYVNPKYGAHSERAKTINKNEFERILEEGKGNILLWMLSPEIDNADLVVDRLYEKGIRISAGHSEARAERVLELIPKGLVNACHMYDAMTVIPYKGDGTHAPGIGAAALFDDRIYTEVICDKKGLHVEPFLVKLLHKIKGPDKVIVITDATINVVDENSQPGACVKGDVRYEGGVLAGSCLTMNMAARNFTEFTNCTLCETFKAASLNPSKMLGIDDKIGSIREGKFANLIIMDDDFNIKNVILEGEFVQTT